MKASKRIIRLVAVLAACFFFVGYPLRSASAHGKEIDVTLASLTPDSGNPLTRLYRATVVYASDLEPVRDARVELVATREESGAAIGAARFTPLEGQPGLYVAEVIYPQFGTWKVSLRVLGPGNGETVFVDRVRPVGAEASEAISAAAQERVRNLQLLFRFSPRDVGNILVRILHAVAGATYFALNGAILAALWFRTTRIKSDTWNWLKKALFPGTLASLGILLVSGLYTAYYNAPVNPPGIFDIETMRRIPYGDAYLATFWIKIFLAASLILVAWQMHRAMNSIAQPVAITGNFIDGILATENLVQLPTQSLLRLSLLYAGVGLLVLVDIAVVTYLHSISHLGILLLPQ